MSGNAQKTPIAAALLRLANKQAEETISLLGRALPCTVESVNGSIVTVKFEIAKTGYTLPNVTCAIAGSEYVRLPIQKGCKGVCFPADARLGVVTGLGGETTDLTRPANLAALTFFPLGNTKFKAPENPKILELYGPDGTIIKNADRDFWIQATKDGIVASNKAGTLKIETSGAEWIVTGPVRFKQTTVFEQGMQMSGNITAVGGGVYAGSFTTSGNIVAGNISLTAHHHTAQGATGPTTAAQA